MKKLNFLSNLWRLFRGSRKDDGSTRLRVVFDSFTCRLRICPLKLVSVLAILLTIGVGNAWGAVYTYDFTKGSSTSYWTSDNSSTSVGTSNIGTFYYMQAGYSGHCFAASGTNYKFNTTNNQQCFFLGKSGAKLTLPTYTGQLITSVTVYMRSGQGSASAQINIYSGSNAASTAQTASTSGVTFAISEDYQDQTLSLQVTSAHNTSVQTLVITTAVEGCEWSETFSLCAGTGGNSGGWNGSIASGTMVADNTGWTFSNQKAADKCGKFGTTSGGGSAQTPTLTGLLGTLTVNFKAGAWDAASEGTTLSLATTQGTLSASSVTLKKGQWTNYSVTISNVATATKITFYTSSANKRFFLDDICVSTASCSTDPTVGTAQLNGAFSLSSVPLTCTASAGDGCSISAAGFVWKASSDPSSSDNPTTGSYSTNITGTIPSAGSLSLGTTYYIKAYATNSHGTTYSTTSFQLTPRSVTFHKNDGSESTSTQYVNNGVATALTANAWSRTGYTFAGWATSSGGDVAYADEANVTASGGNVDLYAKWTAKTSTVTLNKNGATTGSNQTVSATYGSAMPTTTTSSAALVAPTKTAHTLLGYWDTDASTGGNKYYNDDMTSAATWDKETATATLYARWEAKVDQFIDDMHGTTGYTSGSPHEESGAGYTMPGPLSENTGGNDCESAHYTFVGWVTSGGQNDDGTIKGSPKIWQPGESNNASGATYYAVWAEE